MGLLKVLFFLFLTLVVSAVHSENNCPSHFCGNNTFQIRYPFKMNDRQHQNCNYTYVKCKSTQDIAVLDLPFYGDFYIQYIDYDSSMIELYEPNNCLPRRLMNMRLQDSPFVIKDYQNFTFYNCPPEAVKSNLTSIECLSNSTNAVVATSSISSQMMEGFYGCSVISTSRVPASWFDSYDFDGSSDKLVLTWYVPVCNDCPKEKGRWKLKVISKFFAFVLMIPAIAVLLFFLFVCVACCIQTSDNFTRQRTITNQSATAPRSRLPTTLNTETSPYTGLDDSRFKSCLELVVLDVNETQTPENFCCSICLEGYSANEKVRRINLCRHCFHADCIDRWLRKSSTCPICRVSILDAKL